MLFWDHFHDVTSYVLCPPEDDVSDPLVHKASLPVKLPPAISVDDLAAPQPMPAKKTFDKPLAPGEDLHDEPKDLTLTSQMTKMKTMMTSSWNMSIMPLGLCLQAVHFVLSTSECGRVAQGVAE